MLLTFDHVTKLYGPVVGVNDACCRVGPGITCLFGSNGAGKSTLMKLASGQLRPTSGKVLIGDHPARSTAARWHFGYSPDLHRFYEDMSGREFVFTMACLCGFSRREARERSETLLTQMGMADRANRPIAGYSHGMRQRIKLAQAAVHDPDVLLLDEPMGGIDPGGRREIGQVLLQLARRGKTILISSHLLSEVEHLTDSILMLARGRIIASGTLSDIRELLEDQPLAVEIVAEPARKLAGLLVQLEEVESLKLRDASLTVHIRQPAIFFGHLSRLALEEGILIERFEVIDAGADAVFEYLHQGADS